MLQRIRNLGINIDQLVPVKQMTEEESTFTALQASGKTRGEIISQMNISPEQYQRLYMRLKSRNK
jgi:fructose-1,6-bisphosphatase/sedoheptulose 1,7-bisphosphatase-like protein